MSASSGYVPSNDGGSPDGRRVIGHAARQRLRLQDVIAGPHGVFDESRFSRDEVRALLAEVFVASITDRGPSLAEIREARAECVSALASVMASRPSEFAELASKVEQRRAVATPDEREDAVDRFRLFAAATATQRWLVRRFRERQERGDV